MGKSLRIAMLSAIKRPITPDTTISRLRVIVDLAQGLMRKGHAVTLITTQDSVLPGAEIIGVPPKGLNSLPAAENPFYQHIAYLSAMIQEVRHRQGSFDIVHNHMYPEFLPLLAEQAFAIPMITTFHAQMTAETALALKYFDRSRIVAISESAQRLAGLPLPVIHNGIDTELFVPPTQADRTYLLFVGRMSSAKDSSGAFIDPKGVMNAIAVAEQSDMPLKIVGNVEDPAFYETLVQPHLNDRIELVGGVSKEQHLTRPELVRLYQGAIALVNTINWEEPFGLVMAEAMACGTPVIAFRRGSVPELVRDGETGYIIAPDETVHQSGATIETIGIDGAVEAVRRVGMIDTVACRDHAVRNFSIAQMVERYESAYVSLLEAQSAARDIGQE